MKTVLITGAEGNIGSGLRRNLADRYSLRALTRAPVAGLASTVADIADLEAILPAFAGVEAVIHLAASATVDAAWEDVLHNNIEGLYNVFEASRRSGVKQVVFASSNHAVGGYEADGAPAIYRRGSGVMVGVDAPLRPDSLYGVSKVFGEAVAHVFAHTEGLSSIAIRIGAYDAEWLRRGPGAPELGAFISHRDLNQLLVRCIETPEIRFAIVHGVSDNRYKRLDLASTRELLGYAPEDDAFKVFGDDLPRIFETDPRA